MSVSETMFSYSFTVALEWWLTINFVEGCSTPRRTIPYRSFQGVLSPPESLVLRTRRSRSTGFSTRMPYRERCTSQPPEAFSTASWTDTMPRSLLTEQRDVERLTPLLDRPNSQVLSSSLCRNYSSASKRGRRRRPPK